MISLEPPLDSRGARVMLISAVLAIAIVLPLSDAPNARDGAHVRDSEVMPMTPEAMSAWINEYYETHPVVMPEQSTGFGAVTFNVQNFRFELNGDTPGQIDTAFIMENESVSWVHVSGSHTVTSGTGFVDPQAGALFDVPFNFSGFFSRTYTEAGTFPFFCRPHELAEMKGVVVVQGLVDVARFPGEVTRIGFTSPPFPSPTRAGVTFRFALSERGRAQVRLYDASGRLVARVIDRILEPGAYVGSWDSRTIEGRVAPPGVYYLHLAIPGRTESRRISVVR